MDNIMNKGLRVLIGDANGFDTVAQNYFSSCDYPSVEVYCTRGICRNNVGKWPIRGVDYVGSKRDFDFYAAKDDVMLRDAHFGLFAWDGKSRGTLRNVRLMTEAGKLSAVFVATSQQFVTVRYPSEVDALLAEISRNRAFVDELFSDAWRAA